MTDITPQQQAQVPATQADVSMAPEGLEDFGTEDRVMPMLRIDHHENVFTDALSGETFPELNVILLGLVKQRVLWPATMSADDDSEPPLCRSYNFKEGHPSKPEILANGTEYDRFPWDATQFVKGETETLACQQCPLKEWGSHPSRDVPWCSEQHTFVLVIPQEDGNMVPCLFQLQRSGIKPSRQYLSSFANANTPLFTVYTSIKLEQKKFGNNPFSVPKFARNGAVSQDLFPEFSAMYRNIREYLQTPRSRDEEEMEDNMGTETPVQAPVQQQAPAPAAPAPQPAPQQPAPAPAPAPEPAPQPAAAPQQPAPAPQEPAPAPVAAPAEQPAQQPVEETPQAAPAQAAAPSIGGAAPAAPAQPAPAPAPAPAAADDDEIPF